MLSGTANYSPGAIAPAGQASTQVPQSTQASASITYLLSPSVIQETGHPAESCVQRWYKVVSLQENTTAVSLFTFGTKKYFPNRTSYVEGKNKTAPISPRKRFWNRIKEIFGL